MSGPVPLTVVAATNSSDSRGSVKISVRESVVQVLMTPAWRPPHIRPLLEPAAAERAARCATAAEPAGTHRTVEQMRRPLRGDTYEASRGFAEVDAAFHHAIAIASSGPLMADTLRRFRVHPQLPPPLPVQHRR
ncbi:FCD domain-containing protein [Streptomyces asiaticus]